MAEIICPKCESTVVVVYSGPKKYKTPDLEIREKIGYQCNNCSHRFQKERTIKAAKKI
jgi:hypothetical protein